MLASQQLDGTAERGLSAMLRMVGCLVRWRQKLVSSRGDTGAGSVLASLGGLHEYMSATAKSVSDTASGHSEDLMNLQVAIAYD
jgi:hypothetical protein